MKKKLLVMICSGCLLFAGCSSGVTQEEYTAVKESYESAASQNEEYQKQIESLSAENEQLESNLSEKQEELDSLNSEYEEYRESMSEYEGLAAAEAESRRIEAESIAAAEAESKAAAEAEAKAAAEAEAKAGYETGITYDQLARNPDDYEGKLVKFSGKVVQVLEGESEIEIRFAVNSDYDKILYCGYPKDIVSSRVLEDDKITIYGTSVGLISYESTMGATITIPAVYIDRIDQ